MYHYANHPWSRAKMMGVDYLALGMFGQIAGVVVTVSAAGTDEILFIAGQIILVLFTGLLAGGCALYAKHHRMTVWWSIAALFSVFGVLALLCISFLRRLNQRKQLGEGFGVIFAEPYQRHVWRMGVKVTLDNSLGSVPHETITLQIPRGANVGTAMKTLGGVIPELNQGELPSAIYVINGHPGDRRSELNDGDSLQVSLASVPSQIHSSV